MLLLLHRFSLFNISFLLFQLVQSAKMGRKSRGCYSGKFNEENKENIKEIVDFKDNQKKYFSKCSMKSIKNNISTKALKKSKKIERVEKDTQKAMSYDNILKKGELQIMLNRCDDSFNVSKALKNTEKIIKPVMSYDSTQSTEVECKKQDASEIRNGQFHNSITKEAVVMLKKYEDIQKEHICPKSYGFSKVENIRKSKKIPNEPKSIMCECESHSSFLLKEAVVVLERYGDIQETFKSSNSFQNSDMLEDGGKAKKVPNKSGKGTKRKREEKSKQGSEESSKSAKSQKQKDSGQSKSSKREEIPDVSAIDFNNDSKSSSGNLWNFKISSWNVNGIRAWLEKNGLSYLHHEQPDILCIQETKCSDDKLPDKVKKIEGYHVYWLSGDKDGYSGVGLLSKEKPIEVKYGIGISEHDNEGRVITAEYDKFYLVSTYVPNAGRGLVRLEYRMNWDKDFREYLKKLDAKKPVILCGDLNVAHEEIDLANPKTNKKNAGFTKEEREGFSALLKEEFIDTFRHLYPDVKGAYTFWTYMMNARAKNVGWRLDYFVISERFTENLCDNVIRKDVYGSDHCPITLFLSL